MFWLGSGPDPRLRRDADHRHLHLDLRLRHRRAAADLLLAQREQARAPYRAAGLARDQPCSPCGSSPTSRASISSRTICGCPSCATRGCALALSIVGMVLSLLIIGVRGFNYGVDFKGGSMLEVQSKSGPADIGAAAREARQARARRRADPGLRRAERRADPRRGAAGRRGAPSRSRSQKVMTALGGPVYAAARRGRGAGSVERAQDDRHHRRRRRPAGDQRLRLVPLRMAVRRRRRAVAGARRAAGGGHLLAASSSSSTCRSWRRC